MARPVRAAKTVALAKITRAAVKAGSGSKAAPRSTSVKIVATPATVAGRKSSSKKAGVTSISITSKPVSKPKSKSASVKKAKRAYSKRPHTTVLSSAIRHYNVARRLHGKAVAARHRHRGRSSHKGTHHVGRVAALKKKITQIKKRIAFHDHQAFKNSVKFESARLARTQKKYQHATNKHLAFVSRLTAMLARRMRTLAKHEGEVAHHASAGRGVKSSRLGHYISKKKALARTRQARVHKLEFKLKKALSRFTLSGRRHASGSKSKSKSASHRRSRSSRHYGPSARTRSSFRTAIRI